MEMARNTVWRLKRKIDLMNYRFNASMSLSDIDGIAMEFQKDDRSWKEKPKVVDLTRTACDWSPPRITCGVMSDGYLKKSSTKMK